MKERARERGGRRERDGCGGGVCAHVFARAGERRRRSAPSHPIIIIIIIIIIINIIIIIMPSHPLPPCLSLALSLILRLFRARVCKRRVVVGAGRCI